MKINESTTVVELTEFLEEYGLRIDCLVKSGKLYECEINRAGDPYTHAYGRADTWLGAVKEAVDQCIAKM